MQVGKTCFHDVPKQVTWQGLLLQASRHQTIASVACVHAYAPAIALCRLTVIPCAYLTLQMRCELWLSQLHRKGPQGGAPTQGDFYDLLFEASVSRALHRCPLCCCCAVHAASRRSWNSSLLLCC